METHLRCEGSEGKVLKMDRPYGRRVLKFDGLSGRGLWWRLTPQVIKKERGWRRGLCRRVVVRFAQGGQEKRFLGLTGLWPEGS